MMLGARTAAWAKSGGSLPYDAEVEWLESTGKQWIDTGIFLNANSRVIIRAASTRSSQSNNTLLGVGHDGGSSDRVQVHFGSAAGSVSVRIDGTLSAYVSMSTNIFVAEINIATQKGFLNGNEIVSGFSGDINTSMSLGLFNRHISVGWDSVSASAKLYSLSAYEGLSIVADFIPVRKDGVGYLYNRANLTGGPLGNGLYPNIGTGEFIVGPDKT